MDSHDPNCWLDTETKAALQRRPPLKIAPPVIDAYAVVILSLDPACGTLRRVTAFERAMTVTHQEAKRQLARTPPFVAMRGLTLADAMLAQFELICGDVCSIFLSEEVVSHAPSDYLANLYFELAKADEFQRVHAQVVAIPDSRDGQAFAERFIGGTDLPPMPFGLRMMRKKGRIMSHWAHKVGAIIEPLF